MTREELSELIYILKNSQSENSITPEGLGFILISLLEYGENFIGETSPLVTFGNSGAFYYDKNSKILYFKVDDAWIPLIQNLVGDITIVQDEGENETSVMSQKAVSISLNNIRQALSSFITSGEIQNLLSNYVILNDYNSAISSITNELSTKVTSQELSDGLGTKVTAVANQRLITEEEAIKLASSVTSQELSDGLATKVTAVANQRLITEEEANSIAEAITRTAFEDELSKKVDAVPNQRLITEEEANSIAEAVTRTTFEDELSKKVDAVQGAGLITDAERTSIANAVDSATLSTELAKKVTAVANQRLITEQEATKLAYAVTSGDLEPYSLKDTGVLEEIIEVPKEEKQYIKLFDEVNGIEKKISTSNFILSVSSPVYPTARALGGEKNGKNEIFYSEYNYIAGSEKLNINGSVYYPNTGFYKEGNNIILSGAPIPEAGDFMFLEAIYLD